MTYIRLSEFYAGEGLMESRDLLLLNFPHNAAVDEKSFVPEGWRVLYADNPYLANQLLAKHDIRVGLAVFDGKDDSLPDKQTLDLFAENNKLEWVALLSSEETKDPSIFKRLTGWIYDYHTLPIDTTRLMMTIGHAYGIADRLQQDLNTVDVRLSHEMIGSSPAMVKLYRDIGKVAGVDAPVMIAGESGTGKELAARAIHERSRRSGGPFIVVNCGALPHNLVQSELFGHEKGSFTGAIQRRIGSMESASGGTIFLDEIGDLPLDQQVNMLRFLQESTIQRIGDTREIPVDVRVIAATHVDLEKAMAQGQFREDLYYRINVLNIDIPALRDRDEDIEFLAQYYFERFAKEKQVKLKGFSRQAIEVMRRYNWSGNVRELINRVRSAVVMCEKSLICPEVLGLEKRAHHSRRVLTLDDARDVAEREAILSALARNNHNVSAAAKDLSVSRVTMYRLMEKLSIDQKSDL